MSNTQNENACHWLLALESSTNQGGAALLENGVLKDEIPLEKGLRHGRDLMPAAHSLMERQNLAPKDIDVIVVSTGPGSYTGLRVGVMSAKAFSYASGCKLVSVSSLAALAGSHALEASIPAGSVMMTLVEARRDEVYAGLYRMEEDGSLASLATDAAITPEEAAIRYKELVTEGKTILALGTAFASYEKLFAEVPGFSLIPVAVRAAGVGLIASAKAKKNQFEDAISLQPIYLRRDEHSDWRHDELIKQTVSKAP